MISADTTVYDSLQLTEQPRARTVPALTYPRQAVSKKIQGRVVVEAIVHPRGNIEPSSVTVTQTVHPLLDAEARDFVRLASLWPGCRDGEAVRARIAVPVVFARASAAPSVGEAFWIGLSVGLVAMAGTLLRGR